MLRTSAPTTNKHPKAVSLRSCDPPSRQTSRKSHHVQGSWQVKVFKRVLRAKDLHAHDPQRNAPRALRRKKPIFPSPAQQVSRGSQAGTVLLIERPDAK